MIRLQTLYDYCRRSQLDARLLPDRLESRLPSRSGGYDLVVRSYEALGVVGFLIPYYLTATPAETPAAVKSELAELLLWANYELALGGFEYDPRDGEVRYRLSLPWPDESLGYETFGLCLAAARWACEHYYPACQRVIWGGLTAAAALASLAD